MNIFTQEKANQDTLWKDLSNFIEHMNLRSMAIGEAAMDIGINYVEDEYK